MRPPKAASPSSLPPSHPPPLPDNGKPGRLREQLRSGAQALECTREAHDAYNEKLDAALNRMVWSHKGTTNWYKNRKMHAPGLIGCMIRTTRRQQFAGRAKDVTRAEASSSVAVPIHEHGGRRVLGTIGLTYYASAVKRSEIIERFVPSLKTAAAGIGENVARMNASLQSAREPVH